MIHNLKIWPGSFLAVRSGEKTHEIRDCTDRDFTVNDFAILHEWIPDETEVIALGEGKIGKVVHGEYTGRRVLKKITYVSVPGSWGLPPNLCVFSMK